MTTKGRALATALTAAGVTAMGTVGGSAEPMDEDASIALRGIEPRQITLAQPLSGPDCYFQGSFGHSAFDLLERYYSGPDFATKGAVAPPGGPRPMELWRANYDEPDGWLYGFTTGIAPSFLCGGVVDFSYRTGELDGRFTTTPVAGGPVYPGDVDVDRDVWELGLTYPLWNWFYGRVAYFSREDDVTWNYDDGDVEKQEYEMHGVQAGIGMAHEMPVGGTGLIVVLDVFAGLVYFEFEHEEVGGGLKTDWDGFGYVVRGGAEVAYPLSGQVNAVGGVSYEFMKTDDSGLDLENYELLFNLGIAGSF